MNRNTTSPAAPPIEPGLGYQIEPMRIEDFEAVFDLWQRTEGIGLNESDSKEQIAAYLDRNPGLSFVARKGSQVIGAGLCGHDGRRGYLHHLAVEKGFRRQGVGRNLVEACLTQLARHGILKCNLFVFAENGSGEAFWFRNGWT